jgi:hypothetical protein
MISDDMTFQKILDGTDCQCIKNTELDYDSYFVRKISKRSIKDRDFKTQFERNKTPTNNCCEEICSHRSLSVNIYKEEYIDLIIDKYRKSCSINPSTGRFYVVFKLRKNAGRVKSDPRDNDKSHYNFFKSDLFDSSKHIDIKIVTEIKPNETVRL